LRLALAALMIFIASPAQAQPATKKIRMGISTTSIVFLPFYAAMHKGFYKDEGMDLELIARLSSRVTLTIMERSPESSAPRFKGDHSKF